MDKYGNETGNVPKHFMIGSGSKFSTNMVVLKDLDEVESVYRLWSGNKVNKDDIQCIREIPWVLGSWYVLKIGNTASESLLSREYSKEWYNEESRDGTEKCFYLHEMGYRALFYSNAVITNTPELALKSYNEGRAQINPKSAIPL